MLAILVLGFIPTLGLSFVWTTCEQFISLLNPPPPLAMVFSEVQLALMPLATMGAIILSVIVAILLVRHLLARSAKRHNTWACGYESINSRMQYTGSSFSEPFIAVFKGMLRHLKRENLPREIFPSSAYLNSHYVDAVEQRMFKMIGEGEKLITSVAAKIPESSHVSFALGLLVILVAVCLFLMKNGIV